MITSRRAYVRTASGEWHYREAGRGDPLLLLHHAGASGAEFAGVIPLLAERYRVVALDLPGHGASDSLPTAPLIRDYVRVLEEFMDALEIRRAHLGGIHTGAEVCMKAALLHPSRVRSLALYGVLCRDQKSLDELLSEEVLTPISIAADGSHLLKAWRFQALFVPDGTPPQVLHALVTESLNAWQQDTLAHRACYARSPQ